MSCFLFYSTTTIVCIQFYTVRDSVLGHQTFYSNEENETSFSFLIKATTQLKATWQTNFYKQTSSVQNANFMFQLAFFTLLNCLDERM